MHNVYALGALRPVLGRNAYVAPSAVVIGDVYLGDEASVWFGVTIRGDVERIRVGARTNIQDGSVVHVTGGRASTTIGDDVTVGHLALVHGCTVGDRCLVGMGSIILDGAEIGEECLVAAGSLVAPGTKIPPRSVVMGRPGRVVRSVTPADLEMMREAAAHYVERAAQFAEELRPVFE